MTMHARLAAWATRAAAVPREPEGDGFARVEAAPRASYGVALPRACELRGALELLAPSPARTPLFFDLETTGLAHDAPAFVVGLLGFDADGTPWLRQLRLDARAREGAMWRALGELLRELAPHTRIVTYNGSSFDRSIARLKLRRIGGWDPRIAALFEAQHVDLLPICRRLWRDGALPDHRLVTLERTVLGGVRTDDPPGSEIARLGAEWLEGARDPATSSGLDAVLRHNGDDLCGLAALVLACARALVRPSSIAAAVGAARQLLCTARRSEAMVLLRPWCARELPDARRPATIDAALVLAQLERRIGEPERAHALWQAVARAVPGHPIAALALAKDFEHRLRAPAGALAVLATLADPCRRRWARLCAKLEIPEAPERAAAPSQCVAVDRSARPAPPVAMPAPPVAMPGSWRSSTAAPPPARAVRRPV